LAGTNRERPNGIVVTLTGRSLARDKATQATASDTSSQRQCLAGPSRSANALSAQINLLIAGREAVTGKICLVPSGVRSEKRRPSLNHPRLWATFLFAEASDTTLITGAPGIPAIPCCVARMPMFFTWAGNREEFLRDRTIKDERMHPRSIRLACCRSVSSPRKQGSVAAGAEAAQNFLSSNPPGNNHGVIALSRQLQQPYNCCAGWAMVYISSGSDATAR
jgi:hypothetical protein